METGHSKKDGQFFGRVRRTMVWARYGGDMVVILLWLTKAKDPIWVGYNVRGLFGEDLTLTSYRGGLYH